MQDTLTIFPITILIGDMIFPMTIFPNHWRQIIGDMIFLMMIFPNHWRHDFPSAPDDFGAVATVVTFEPSVADSFILQVDIVEDEVVEGREEFTGRLEVLSNQSGVILGQDIITVTIVEDDGRF